MKHIKIEAFNIPDAWFKTVSTIWNEGEIFTVGSGSECTETKKLDLTLHIKHPEIYPLVDDKAPTDMKHVQDYSLTYLYSNFKGDYSYTYGSRLREPVDQIQAITNAIVQCRSNRQLTMTIRVPEDVNNYEPPCVPPETLITTINGFKEAKDVDVGDLVLTHLGRWKKVTKKYQRLYNGEMIKIISSQFNYNLSLTPEHPLYIVEINHCLWNKKEPKLVCKPNCKKQFSCYGKHGVECPKLYRNYLKEWCKAKDINNKHYLIIPKFIETYNEKFSDEEMYIIGLWLAEGDYIKDGGIRFNLGKHETKLINKTVLLMKKIYGLNPHFDNSGQGTSRITFYSTKLVKHYMSVFGKDARNKTLPFNFLYLPNNSLQSLIKGYVDGDGTILNNGYTFFTTSKNLKNIFTLILNKLGVCPSISTVKIKENVYKGRTIKSNGDGYKIDVRLNKKHQKYWEDENNYYIPIKEYSIYNYDGIVFNFEVEEDNSYIANGITVHNCLTMIDLEVLNNKVNMTTYFRCLDKSNTTLYLENDLLKWGTIQEIEKSFLNKNKISLLSYDSNYKVFWNPINKIMKSITNRKIEIITETGRSILVTPNHKFFMFDSELGIIEKQAEDLNINDYLISPNTIDEITEVNIGNDLAYFLGLWLADGYFNINENNRVYQIRIALNSLKDQYIINWLKKFCEKNNYKYSTYNQHGAEIFVIYNKKLINQMKNWGFYNGSKIKKVPNIIFSSTFINKHYFYQGWIDGDANCTSSKKLAQSMQDLLLTLSQGSSIYIDKERDINLNGKIIHANKSYKIIPFNGKRKKGIPYYKYRIKRISNSYKEKHKVLINSDFYFWKIKEINIINEVDEMIDIEMENEPNLCINGLFVHNSWDAYAGLPENIAGLYLLLEAIVNDVNEILISEGCPDEDLLETGEMIFHSKNAHIYKRQYVFVEELLKTKTSRLAEKLIDKELKN